VTPFLIDIFVLAILLFCVWQGLRKGLVLTVGGIIIIFLSAFLAGWVADAYAEDLSESLYPIMMWVAEDAIEEAAQGKGRLSEINDMKTQTEITRDTYEILGIHQKESNKMVDKTIEAITKGKATVKEAISSTLLYALSHALLCAFGFLLFMVGLSLLLHFIAFVVKLPVLNLIDKTGGAVSGLLFGVLILSAIGWVSRFLGIIMDSELIGKTVLLKFFANFNLLAGILGF